MTRLLTEEQHNFMIQHCTGLSGEALTELMNKTFNASFTTEQIRRYKRNHKIRSHYQQRHAPTVYPKEVIDFITEHCKGLLSNDLTDLINKTFGTTYSVAQIQALKKRLKLRGGCDTRFKLGHTFVFHDLTPETIKKISKGWFKSGKESEHYLPIGSERSDSSGYIIVKTGETRWEYKHRVIYTEHYGPVPEGYMVTFRDGNKHNFDPANLVAMSTMALHWLRMRGQTNNKSDELVNVAETITKIKKKIKSIKKKVRDGGEKNAVEAVPK